MGVGRAAGNVPRAQEERRLQCVRQDASGSQEWKCHLEQPQRRPLVKHDALAISLSPAPTFQSPFPVALKENDRGLMPQGQGEQGSREQVGGPPAKGVERVYGWTAAHWAEMSKGG